MDFTSIDSSLAAKQLMPAAIGSHPYTKLYYRCLQKPADVLKVQSGDTMKMLTTSLLAPTDGQLYIFPQYVYLADRLEAFWAYWAQCPGYEEFPPGVAIVGNPGIGKSLFLLYLLAREAAHQRPVIFYRTKTYLFLTPSACYYSNQPFMFDLECYQNVLALVDTDTELEGPQLLLQSSPARVVQAAEPQKRHLKWMKRRSESVQFAINPHKFEDIVNVIKLGKKFVQHPPSRIREVIADYGSNIRTLKDALSSRQHLDREIEAAVTALDLATLRNVILSRESVPMYESAHQLITSYPTELPPDPGTEAYLKSDLLYHVISTRKIWLLVFAHIKEQIDRVEFFRTFDFMFYSLPATSPAAGHLFETWSHDFISRGGKLVLQQMKDDGIHLHMDDSPATTLTMELGAMPMTLYHQRDEVETTSASDMYYIPSAARNLTFDSFFVAGGTGIGLQMTLAATHSLKPVGLKYLRGRLGDVPMRYFIFVIPKHHTFTCEKPTPTTKLADFRFFTLTMDTGDDLFNDYGIDLHEDD